MKKSQQQGKNRLQITMQNILNSQTTQDGAQELS
jgi:hypothetical protein